VTTTSQHRAFLGSLISTHRRTINQDFRCGRNVARPLSRVTNMTNVRGRGTLTHARRKVFWSRSRRLQKRCNGLFESDSAGAVVLGHVGQNDLIARL
jgi:hypothetical protein